MVCDTVHHDYPGSCPSVLRGLPTESADHLTGTADGPVVPSCKSCHPPASNFWMFVFVWGSHDVLANSRIGLTRVL